VNRYLMGFDRLCPALNVEPSLIIKAPTLRQRSELIFRENGKKSRFALEGLIPTVLRGCQLSMSISSFVVGSHSHT
jgi:hypothetical protein